MYSAWKITCASEAWRQSSTVILYKEDFRVHCLNTYAPFKSVVLLLSISVCTPAKDKKNLFGKTQC